MAFANTTLEKLENRSHSKWDWSGSTAKRNRADWLPGGAVLTILKQDFWGAILLNRQMQHSLIEGFAGLRLVTDYQHPFDIFN
jgi:hypothetical protein